MTSNINYFKHVPSDVIHSMVLYLGAKDQVSLSFVNKRFYSDYNDPYFKELFIKQYPFLKEVSEQFFKPITDFHPSCGWKIVNCVFPADNIFGRVDKIQSSFFQVVSFSIKKELNNYPMKLQTELKTICGSYYQDPSSQIDQAYKKFKKYELEGDKYRNVHNDFHTAFQEKLDANPHFLLQIESLFEECKRTGVSTKEKLSEIDERLADLETIEENTMQLYKDQEEALSEYQQLEKRRSKLDENQKLIFEVLKAIETNPEHIATSYKSIFLKAFMDAKDYEANQFVLSNLKQAIDLINSGFSEEKKNYLLNKNTLEQIQNLINACSFYNISGDIWKELYDTSANGVHESRWSEKHFHEYLDVLSPILADKHFHVEYSAKRTLEKLEKNIVDHFIEKAELESQEQRKHEDYNTDSDFTDSDFED